MKSARFSERSTFTGTPHVRIALRLAPMLFVRPGELRKMEWSELDLLGREWCIPAEKMKTRNPHIVPLAIQAVELLENYPVGQYVFPNGGKDKSKAMSEAAITPPFGASGTTPKARSRPMASAPSPERFCMNVANRSGRN
jgi:integrase